MYFIDIFFIRKVLFLAILFHLVDFNFSFFRGIYTKKVSISRDFLSWSMKSIYYTDTVVKIGEDSTYQELDVSGDAITYQNTSIR